MKIIISERQFNKILDSLLNESIHTKRKEWIESGESKDEVDKYIELYTKYKGEGKFKMNNPFIERFKEKNGEITDIDNFKNFDNFKELVDYFKNQDPFQSNKIKIDLEDSETLVDNETIKIQRGNTSKGCIDIKGDFETSWCIASQHSNLYGIYRYGNYESTFYFVQNKRLFNSLNIKSREEISNLNDENKYCFFVIQVTNKENLYKVTSAKNDGDKEMNWEQIIDIYPELNKYKNIFSIVPISDDEKKYIIPISDLQTYLNLTYHEKELYFNFNELTLDQFVNTSTELLEKYINNKYKLSENMVNYLINKNYIKLLNKYRYINVSELLNNKKILDSNFFKTNYEDISNMIVKKINGDIDLLIEFFGSFKRFDYYKVEDELNLILNNDIIKKGLVFALLLNKVDYVYKLSEDKLFKNYEENINDFFDYLKQKNIDRITWFINLKSEVKYLIRKIDIIFKYFNEDEIIQISFTMPLSNKIPLNDIIKEKNIEFIEQSFENFLNKNNITFENWYLTCPHDVLSFNFDNIKIDKMLDKYIDEKTYFLRFFKDGARYFSFNLIKKRDDENFMNNFYEYFKDNLKYLNMTYRDWILNINEYTLLQTLIPLTPNIEKDLRRPENKYLINERFFKNGLILIKDILKDNIDEFYSIHKKYLTDNNLDIYRSLTLLHYKTKEFLEKYCEEYQKDKIKYGIK